MNEAVMILCLGTVFIVVVGFLIAIIRANHTAFNGIDKEFDSLEQSYKDQLEETSVELKKQIREFSSEISRVELSFERSSINYAVEFADLNKRIVSIQDQMNKLGLKKDHKKKSSKNGKVHI